MLLAVGITIFAVFLLQQRQERKLLDQKAQSYEIQSQTLEQWLEGNTYLSTISDVFSEKQRRSIKHEYESRKKVRSCTFALSIIFFILAELAFIFPALRATEKFLIEKAKKRFHLPFKGKQNADDLFLNYGKYQNQNVIVSETIMGPTTQTADKKQKYPAPEVLLSEGQTTKKNNSLPFDNRVDDRLVEQFAQTVKKDVSQNVHLIKDEKPGENKTETKPENQEIEKVEIALEELNANVGAIRQYATLQQDKLEKLQQGYDWQIIRTFCMKIIWCIDNIESRIKTFENNDLNTAILQEIRDELIFALESSGIEQFNADHASEYHGHEKIFEALKQRVSTTDELLKGKIAETARKGYRYVIDEDNVKIVRPAQVRLYQCCKEVYNG
jgi:molecular chaperone GrpE (heat shock protein)